MLKKRIKNSEYLSQQLKSVLIDKIKRIEALDLVDKKLKDEKLRAIETRVNEIEREVIEDNTISSEMMDEINTEFESKYGSVDDTDVKPTKLSLFNKPIVILILVFICLMIIKVC